MNTLGILSFIVGIILMAAALWTAPMFGWLSNMPQWDWAFGLFLSVTLLLLSAVIFFVDFTEYKEKDVQEKK